MLPLLLALAAPAPFLKPVPHWAIVGPDRAVLGQRVWIVEGTPRSVKEWTVHPAREGYRPDFKWELRHLDAPLWNGRRPVWHQPFHDSLLAWTTREAAERYLRIMGGTGR